MNRFNLFLLFSLQLQMELAFTEMQTFGIVYTKITDWTPVPKALNTQGRSITLQAIKASTAQKIYPYTSESGDVLSPGTARIYLGSFIPFFPNARATNRSCCNILGLISVLSLLCLPCVFKVLINSFLFLMETDLTRVLLSPR